MTRSARSFLPAQRPRILRPTRSSKTIDPSKGKTAAAGAPLASREVAAPIQETGPEAMSIIDGEASTQPQMVTETQQPIENRGDSARYMLQTGGPRLDLSFLVPERVNPAYDPSKAIGGENVPYQESKGIGGFFRRLLGDESNRMNIEAQQAQGAEWKAEAALEKARKAKIEDYRTQRMIDKEIDDARDDKRNAQAIAMFDKSKAAQLEVLKLQNDYAKANTAEEQQNILARMGVAHNNAMALQDKALAASEKNLGLQQNFQTRLANFNAQMQGWQDANKITNMGDGFFARGGEVYGLNKGTPDIGNIKGTPPGVTPPLMGPRAQGAQVPQMDVGGVAPSMGAVTPARSAAAARPAPERGSLFDVLSGNAPEEAPVAEETPAEQPSPFVARPEGVPDEEPLPANTPRFGPFLMEEYNKRAKELAKGGSARPNATDPLMLPMYENIASALGVGSEGVGASRQVRRPASAVIERDLGSYLPKFGKLPPEQQNAAVIDALNKSMKQPRYRTFPNYEYNYNPQ